VFTAQEATIAKSSVTISEIYDDNEITAGSLFVPDTPANETVGLDDMLPDTDMDVK
jgi:hypothetical protein